jgi:hypothetical protein
MCPPFNEYFDESYDKESGFLSCKTYIIIFYYYPHAYSVIRNLYFFTIGLLLLATF